MRASLIAAAAALALVAGPVLGADKIKIGFVTTLSGPEAVMGNPMRDSADLALDMLGGKIGGVPAEIVYGDDQQKPDVGRQIIEKFLEKDRVDFITGILGSNVLLAIYQPVIKSKTIIISANSGPHQIAGEMCSPYFFSTATQNDEGAEAMGQYMTDAKITDVYAMAPNYAAGKDMIAGFKRNFKGNISAEVYTTFGQHDYQAEISQIRAANPKAVFVFYPGGMGIQFVKQYAEAGLKDKIQLYSIYTADEAAIPALQDAAAGNYTAGNWSADLDTPRSRAYVAAFRKKYGYTPANYGADSFDAIFLIDSAVKAVKGDLADKKALIAAMAKADFPSVRGDLSYNVNHFPIENFYLFKIVKDGESYALKPEHTIFTNYKDSYAKDCKMPAVE